MKKNLKSPRTDYRSFKYDENFEETPYFRALKNRLKKRTVLILSKSRSASLNNVTKIINALKNSNMTVYVREYFKDDFKNIPYVKAVTKDSQEYYDALATSQYIYTETFIYSDLIKRPGQVLINNIRSSSTDIKSRINLTSAANKTDWFIGSNGKNTISFKSFISSLAKNSIRNTHPDSSKKKILFIINMKYMNYLYNAFANSVQWMNFDEYDITLLIDWKYVEKYGYIFERLDERIHILAKKGKILTDVETRKRITFLKNEYSLIKKPKKIDAFLPKNLFKNECLRVFGTTEYDFIFNLKSDIFYWQWLVKNLKGKKITVDMNNYSSSALDISGKAYYINKYDNILFLNKESMEKAIKFKRRIFFKKSSIIDYVPFNSKNPQNEPEIFEMGTEKCFTVRKTILKAIDTISVTVLPEFTDEIPYIVIDNKMTSEEATKYISHIKSKNEKLFVFDFFSTLKGNDKRLIISDSGIHYFITPEIYYSLLYKMGDCYCINDGIPGVIHEALNMHKEIVFLDSNMNILDKKAVSNYQLPKSPK